ncbi:hypothetical protein Tco_1178602 [Tanacetum coccineum]
MVVDEGNEYSDDEDLSFIDELVNVNGLAVAEDPENIDPKFNVKQRMTYIRHDPSHAWNAMELVLGMRFEHPEQLKLDLANYGVANGYQLWNYNLGSIVIYKWIAHHYAKHIILDPFDGVPSSPARRPPFRARMGSSPNCTLKPSNNFEWRKAVFEMVASMGICHAKAPNPSRLSKTWQSLKHPKVFDPIEA